MGAEFGADDMHPDGLASWVTYPDRDVDGHTVTIDPQDGTIRVYYRGELTWRGDAADLGRILEDLDHPMGVD
jgi:hypothetical protein